MSRSPVTSRRTWPLTAAIMLAAMLSGCHPVVSGSRLTQASFPAPAPDSGAVLFGLHASVQDVKNNRVVGQFLTFERANPPAKRSFTFYDVNGQSVFLVALPPGTWTSYFEIYASVRTADGNSGVRVRTPPAFNGVEVKPGAVTVLGTVDLSADVTREKIVSTADLEKGTTGKALVRAALDMPAAQARGWTGALQRLLDSSP